MLETIEIDGFRSLIGFKVRLRPGLNVVVGANGTGKSNFISFLDFLGTLIDSGLNSAIAVAQGAGSMFSRERFGSDKPTDLTFTLSGQLGPISERDSPYLPFSEKELRGLAGSYTYSCTISYLAAVPAVFISSERISISSKNANELTISRRTSRDTSGFHNVVDIVPRDHRSLRSSFRFLRHSEEKTDATQYLSARIVPDRSILPWIYSEAATFLAVFSDLTRYRSINIDPNLARRPTPVGTVSTLQSNGEGLAGALYQLRNGVYFRSRGPRLYMHDPSRSGEEIFQSIISWCREVNPSIEGVDVKLDVMEAQLRPYMNFRYGRDEEQFSFGRISDGTVKWLALTTLLFAEPGLSLIEEPENFLHPFMQESFVALCRQALERDSTRILVISTHSPTLLDCCRPSELTLFDLVGGMTRASEVANYRELEKKLQESRFGLGHYYRIGALHGANSSDS